MDSMQALYRRSCRSYLPKPVEDEKIEKILDVARAAPTGRNNQELKFHVIKNKQFLDDLVIKTQQELAKTEENKAMAGNAVTYGAPCGICMTCKKDMLRWADFDCGFASQNMLVASELLGLGALPIGLIRRVPDVWLDALKCDKESEELLLLVVFGYRGEEKPHEKIIKSEVVYVN